MQQSITMASDFGRDFVHFFKGSHFLALVQVVKPANEQGNGDGGDEHFVLQDKGFIDKYLGVNIKQIDSNAFELS